MVDKVEANRNLNSAKAVEAVLENLLNNYGGSSDRLLQAAKNELENTRQRIKGLKVLLK